MPEPSAIPVKRACDACHRRKVKCIGESASNPCKNCSQANLKCTYNAVPQKKGPKGSRAKVISELRENQRQTTVAPKAREHFDFANPPAPPSFSRVPNFLPIDLVDSCVEFFFTNVYPTQPILNRQRLQQWITEMHHNVEAYCLVVSLCAYMLIQPNMQLPTELGLQEESNDITSTSDLGAILLAEAIEARKASNYIEIPSPMSVTTSFFLFGCYFCLEKHNTAYFHLREATTIALLLGMNQEDSYTGTDVLESLLKRRLYWLLFITERAYALQMQRPLSLHATIALPDAGHDPEEAVTLQGFNHLILLYKPFDDMFVGLWNQSIDGATSDWIVDLQGQLSAALPQYLQSTETQAVDLKTSQQWLRIMIWQLSISNRLLSSTSVEQSMTFRFPVELSRELAAEASHFTQQAMEVHGIGLVGQYRQDSLAIVDSIAQIKKLFDVACTLCDVLAYVPIHDHGFELGPRHYLQHFLQLMTKLRGGQTRYVPLLISKTHDVLPSLTSHFVPPSLSSGVSDHYDGLTDSVDVMHDRVDGMHDGVEGLHDGVNGMHDGVDGMHDGVDGMHDGVDGMHDGVDGMHDGVDGMHDGVDGMHDGVDGIHGVVDGIDGMSDGGGADHDTISAPNSAIRRTFRSPLHPPTLKPEYSDLINTPYGSTTGSSPFSPQSSVYG